MRNSVRQLLHTICNSTAGRAMLGVMIMVAVGGVVQHIASAAAPQFPTGFFRTQINTQQTGLTDFAFLPDSQGTITRNILTISKFGNVGFVGADGATRAVGSIGNVYDTGDLGLVSVSLSPNYLSSRQIAVLGTYKASPLPLGRIDIYTVDNAANPTSITFTRTVVNGITQNNNTNGGTSHGPGTVIWAPDGTLYAGFGDAALWSVVDTAALRALDPDDPHGKILHVTSTGQGVPGNPYYNAASPDSWRSRVFASGQRNPFRFSLDPQRSDVLYIGDVGLGTYEKITITRAGTVGGWPCYEGVNGTGGHQTPGYRDLTQCQHYYSSGRIDQPGTTTYKETIPRPTAALWNMAHGGQGAAIVGGTFYTGSTYPAAYSNAYFFANFPPDSPSKLFSLMTDGTTLTRAPEAGGFASSIGGPVAIHSGPGGDLYYADITDGSIWQLKYAPGNRLPEVKVTTTTTANTKTVCFDASGTVDLDGDPYTVRIAFGDGQSGEGKQLCHTYPSAGPATTYMATISATDSAGGTGTKTVTVAPANNAPAIEVTAAPSASKKFAVGEAIRIQLRSTDAEDGRRPVVQQTDMVHCASSTDCHTHSDAPVNLTTDANGVVTYQTTFDDHGQNTSQVLRFTTKDSIGVETTWSYRANPDLRTITVVSPAPVAIDGIATTTLQVAVGSQNSVSVPEASEHLVFDRWSDGGARVHNFTMGTADLQLQAYFATAIDQFNQTLNGRLGNPVSAETSVGNGRMRSYQYGVIYWSPGNGAHFVVNGIRAAYDSRGGPTGILGFPLTSEFAINGGARQNFQNGALVWTASNGTTYLLYGANWAKYDATGGVAGRLGLPIGNEYVTARGGVRQNFQGGSLLWSPQTGSWVLVNGIRAAYDSRGGPESALGFPRGDEFAVAGGARQNFQAGALVWSAANGTFMLYGANWAKYDALGGPAGMLGFPVSNEYTTVRSGVRQDFQRGSLLWSVATGSHYTYGAIGARYIALGGPSSRLGLPVTDEFTISGGVRQNFQGGYITWQAASGWVSVVYY